ncbi:glycosyltransferase family 2 protein [Asticcacaulis taihuensis]|uniref:glycosyltransferase family 2 protein n=1 Tax=Asticcacaulis taihuensis TaxID=260084 RepID=UPI003F7BADEA
MKAVDLLSDVKKSLGANPVTGGIQVNEVRGRYETSALQLEDGWYEFYIEGQDAALRLQLYDTQRFRLVDLAALTSEPAVVRLSQGYYELTVLAGVRPGFYPLERAEFRILPVFSRWRLLAGRFFQALRRGMGWRELASRINMALRPQTTFGIRVSDQMASGGLGVLMSQDLAHLGRRGDYAERIQRLANGPIFLIESVDGNKLADEICASQAYERYTFDSQMPYDYILRLKSGECLLPDALLLLAEFIASEGDAEIILTDEWVGVNPTARIAWDPLLYSESLPTPYACKRGVRAEARFDNQADFSILSIPLAESAHECAYKEFSELKSKKLKGEEIKLQPPCSIIIPTRDRADLLEACLEGVLQNTAWQHEIIIVDNGSVEDATFALFDAYAVKNVKIIRADIPFNFSTLCNLGAATAQFDYLLFLNNDVVVQRPDWLDHLMFYAQMKHVGAVGAKLLYADRRLQHGGVMLGLTQLCGHLWRGLPYESQIYQPQLQFSSLRSAVTGACLCIAKEKFQAVGGFDEDHFPVTLNDVDLCLRLLHAGWFNVYAARSEAFHLEGESRGVDDDSAKQKRRQAELDSFYSRWHDIIFKDKWLPAGVVRSHEYFEFQ